MRTKFIWTLILTSMFVCLATACQTAGRWTQCQAVESRPTNAAMDGAGL